MSEHAENGSGYRLLGIFRKPTQRTSKWREPPELVQDLLLSRPGQKIRVMNQEERLRNEAQAEQWLRDTKG